MKRLAVVAFALLAAGFVLAPLATVLPLPGERKLKELVGINPDGCIVRNAGDRSQWREAAALPSLRDGPAAATLGGSVYLLGGIESFTEDFRRARSVATFERLDIGSGQWTRLPPLPRALNHVALSAAGGMLYAFGGHTDSLREGEATADAWRFDPKARRWEAIAPLPTARGAAAATVVDGRIYVVGGKRGQSSLATNESYDPRADEWRRHADMPTRRDHLGAVAFGRRIYAAGGRKEDEESLRTLEVYDPVTDAWRSAADLPEPKAGFGFVAGPDGPIAAGGEDLARWTLYGGVFGYRPDHDDWVPLPAMAEPRHGFGAAIVHGRLYALGGSRCSGFLPDTGSASMALR